MSRSITRRRAAVAAATMVAAVAASGVAAAPASAGILPNPVPCRFISGFGHNLCRATVNVPGGTSAIYTVNLPETFYRFVHVTRVSASSRIFRGPGQFSLGGSRFRIRFAAPIGRGGRVVLVFSRTSFTG